ncbi:MAG TPA: FAD-dependent oxidoreductase [Terriglobales bacterium]|nr:FAD-dependent oxidoreductase [Terriglobales bacterium]
MKTVSVVGAGPAGLFAAQKIALSGHQVLIFNRDIKPGGLAEYGIYPVKHKMKDGLRKQFAKVLGLPNVHYFGGVPIGSGYAFSISDLREFGPSAMVFAVGAQGTKKLGIPGEDARGVFAAKDFVYHYNQLPPFAWRDFSTRKRIAIVGMGNVMVDVARWLLLDLPDRQTEEVIVVARRGPFEAKFEEREFAYIEPYLDHAAFHDELRRIREKLCAAGQDISKVPETTFPALNKPQEATHPRLRFRFLSSPQSIQVDVSSRIARLTVTDNVLVARDGSTAAKATDSQSELEVDTMIFAIGDVVDPVVGLPCGPEGYVTTPDPTHQLPPAYEVFDPQAGKVVEGTYVVGWARKASEGLVGIARHDGEVGAARVLSYLEGVSEKRGATVPKILDSMVRRGLRPVTKGDLAYLASAEQKQAQEQGLSHFKFSSDTEMLDAIEKEKCCECIAAGV